MIVVLPTGLGHDILGISSEKVGKIAAVGSDLSMKQPNRIVINPADMTYDDH